MNKDRKNLYNNSKEFTYKGPEKKDPEYEDLLESHKKLKESYTRLDTNMRTMFNDNKTLRKHVIYQEKYIKSMSDEMNKIRSETRRLREIIEMILKEDEKGFK